MQSQYQTEKQGKSLSDELFHGVQDGMLVLDRNLNILQYNDALLRLFDRKPPRDGDFSSRSCFKCLRGRDEPCRRCPVRLTFHDGCKHEKIEHVEETGRWLELSSFPLHSRKTNRIDRVIEFVRDVTEQKKHRTIFEDIRVEETSDVKSLFLAQMSHEIRTPLNGVIGMTELLLETELTRKQREYVELAQASGKYLLLQISDILDFTKIQAGKLELEFVEFDLPELAESVLGLVAARAMENDLELYGHFQTDFPKRVFGDPGRIRQVLLHLLENAVKFTKRGGVQLDISVLDWETRQGISFARTRFEVRDSGIGILLEDRERLFKPFSQVDDSSARTYGGIGLGLAISKELVQLMGGEIDVETSPGRGSTFWFTLPLRWSEDQHLCGPNRIRDYRKECGENRSGQKNRDDRVFMPDASDDDFEDDHEVLLLVVEDNRVNQIVVTEILDRSGFRFKIVENGEKACEAVADHRFSLILMDCQMPVMDGYQATRIIRLMEAGQNEKTPRHQGRIPIIALTANAVQGDEELCLCSGMDAYCSKPIKAAQLVDAIRKWLPRPVLKIPR